MFKDNVRTNAKSNLQRKKMLQWRKVIDLRIWKRRMPTALDLSKYVLFFMKNQTRILPEFNQIYDMFLKKFFDL